MAVVDFRSIDALFGDLFGPGDEMAPSSAERSARVSDPVGLGPQVSAAAGGRETFGRPAAGSATRAERAQPAGVPPSIPPTTQLSSATDDALLWRAAGAFRLSAGQLGSANNLSPQAPLSPGGRGAGGERAALPSRLGGEGPGVRGPGAAPLSAGAAPPAAGPGPLGAGPNNVSLPGGGIAPDEECDCGCDLSGASANAPDPSVTGTAAEAGADANGVDSAVSGTGGGSGNERSRVEGQQSVADETAADGSCCSSNFEGDLSGTAEGAGGNTPSEFSRRPVRYFDGVVKLAFNDLPASHGFGVPWGLTRSWTNAGSTANGYNGSGMVVTQLPHLRQDGSSTVSVVVNGVSTRYYDLNLVTGIYVPRFFVQDSLVANSSAKEFVETDTLGQQTRFNDFSVSLPAAQRGTFKSFKDADGNVTSVTSSNTDGKPTEIQRSSTVGSVTVTESYLYSYIASGTNAGLMSSVVFRRQANGGLWTIVRQVQYTYYAGEAHGNTGDLKLVQVQDAQGNTLETTYYRYYTGESGGFTHALKYVFRPRSYVRLTTALGTSLDTISDTSAAPYADNYFEFDASSRVTKEVVQADGASSGTGLGTYLYAYTTSTNSTGTNSWATKTVETLPDSNQHIVYTNGYGEVMLYVYYDVQGSGSKWETFYQYDSAGRVLMQAMPSAVTGYDDTKADLLNKVSNNYQYLSDTTGLIRTYGYATSTTATTSTPGDVAGYLKNVKVQQGETGSAITLASKQYIQRNGSLATVYPVANRTVYRNTDGTGAETTSYSYTWVGTTTQVQSVTVSYPIISSGQNGPGTADSEVVFVDGYNRPTWVKDADGFIFYTAYDQATGGVVKTIDDVNTNDTGDFTGLPSGWVTPSGGGLELITQYTADALGRTTKLTDPVGNVSYVVYKDTNHEERVYPGWQSGTNTTTGPTVVYREDRAGSYFEVLTMSAVPNVTGGQPDGTEAIGSVQELARAVTNSVGQVVYDDRYVNLSGITYGTSVTLGTQGTNYYRSQLDYDSRGRHYRTLTQTGTYYKTLYDGLGRPVSDWVGTNDGSPGNMTQTAGYAYDAGGVGDSDLTQLTLYPGGSAANRVSNFYYDWRDRLVASKDGVQGTEDSTTHRPILFRTFDNLDEITQIQRYDGDGVTITSSGGVPQPPSASLLRAQTAVSYDDQGRVYQTQVYSVDPSTGTVSSTALTTNVWYDHRGNVLKTSEPGGLVTKYAYDGAGRTTKTYLTDGGGDTAWSDAGNVTSDNVLSQVETSYDANGNVILTTDRERNHDETATGALGDPNTAPKARVYYAANYFDAADRLTASVDVGTNGGTAYTRPSSPPARSDTALVTSLAYAADSVQQVQLTGNPTGGTFTLTFNGQTTTAIAYNASASTVQSALQALSSIGSGNALVAQGPGLSWNVRFAGTLAGAVEPALTGNGSGLTGGTSPSVAITVTSLGGDAGRVQQVTDPRGIVAKTDYDWLGRTVRTVEAFSAFAPSSQADKTTEYTYDGMDHVVTLQADLVGGAYEQTKWVYGVTTAGGSNLNSNDLVSAVQHPDKSSGNPSSSEQDSQTVNALGQTLTATDRSGNVHTYTYDVLGRLTSDAVTTLGSGVDGAVRRIEVAYDTQGNPYLVTSYDAASGGNVVNQVQRSFNGLGQLITEYQSHSGAVNVNTTPKVQYGWSAMAGGANHSRLTSITYPNGKVLTYNYNSGLDDSLSRLSSLSDTSGTLESYAYLGLGAVVKRAHPQPGVDLTSIKQSGESNGDAGDQYTGLDRFGRVVDQRWLKTSNGSHTDRFQYGYDRDGNPLYRDNLVNTAFGELYHANGSGNGYDNLNQLQAFARGTLNATKDTITSPSHSQSFTPDAAGNFSSVTTDGTAVSRTNNKQNEVTQVGSNTLTFDANGNLTKDDTGQQYVYDAWNRLVAVKNSGGTTIVSYKYDGLDRRIVENPGTARDLYYSAAWQVLEERLGGVSTATVQYVWSPVYVDALVLRDRSTLNNGTLDERLWVQQDANYNVTALYDGTGTVQERYVYDPYGKQTVLDASWNTRSSSSYGFVIGFQGARLDTTSGLYGDGARDLSPTLGRWLQADPIGFGGGDANLYRFVADSPTGLVDPSGLMGIWELNGQWGFFTPEGLEEAGQALAAAGEALQQQQLIDDFHFALTVAKFLPLPGACVIAGLADAGLYLYEGKPGQAGIEVAMAAIPGAVGMGGKLIRGAKAAKGVQAAEDAALAAKGGKGLTKGLRRPYIRKGVRAEVEARAPRAADGRPIDPNTGEPINGRPDLGHKPGHEFWREKAKAQAEGLTQKQFNDRMNNPDLYQLEDPCSNRSHMFEKPR